MSSQYISHFWLIKEAYIRSFCCSHTHFYIVLMYLHSTSFFLCFLMSIGGFLAFTNKTSANILNNFPKSDVLINISRVLFGMNMFLTFPMECFVCREVIFHYLWSHSYHPTANINLLTSTQVHVLTTLLLVFSAMLIALTSCDLGFILEITGGFAATVLAFILPAACYLKLSNGSFLSEKKLPSVLIIGFGIIVMVLSTILSISKFISEEKSHC